MTTSLRAAVLAVAGWAALWCTSWGWALEPPYRYDGEWGSSGYGLAQFQWPVGTHVTGSGHVYVTDSGSQQVKQFTSVGELVALFGEPGSGDGQLGWPRDCTVDAAGNVYVADPRHSILPDPWKRRVQVFGPDGSFLRKWGSEGRGDGQFRTLRGIALDGSANVYVADDGRIQKCTSTGTLLGWWGRGVYWTDTNGNGAVEDGEWTEGFTGWHDPGSGQIAHWNSGDGQFLSAADVAVDTARGWAYVADTARDDIQKFTTGGTFLLKWGSSGSGDGEFDGPVQLAVDAAGNVYVVDRDLERVQKFDSNGTFLCKWGDGAWGDSRLVSPGGIGVDAAGKVYVADSSRSRIARFRPDSAPTANDDGPYPTDEDVAATGNVLTNDSDPDGDPLTASKASDPAHGTVTVNSNGSFTYTPASDFHGTDSFTYKNNDGDLDSNVATVEIAVIPVNDAPVANDDGPYNTPEDTPLALDDLLDNDTDVDGDELSGAVVTAPAHGTLTAEPVVGAGAAQVTAQGAFWSELTYTPDSHWHGTDTFAYKANDGEADSNIATVTIVVTEDNDGPVADDDAYTTSEDAILHVPPPGVLDGDTDTEGDPLTVDTTPVDDVDHGTLDLNADGSFTYEPDDDWHGTDDFTYEVSDGNGGTDQALVTLTVDPVPDAPEADDNAYATNEDTTLIVAAPGVLDGDTDADGDSLTVSGVVDYVDHGALVIEPNGAFAYYPGPQWNGADEFTYEVSDGGLTDTAVVTINVGCVNDPPVAVDDGPYLMDEGDVLNVNGVLDNDTDADDDPLTAAKVTDPGHGAVTLHPDGSFTYTPNASFVGTDTFTYKAQDGQDDSNVATVTIIVAGTHPCIQGWGLLSIPVQPDDPSPQAALASLGQCGPDWRLWDMVNGRYYEYPDPRVRHFALGRGFGLRFYTAGTLRVTGTPADPDQPFAIPLPAGWSVVGCPFTAVVPWDDAHVQVECGAEVVPLSEAIARRWIADPIYEVKGGCRFPISGILGNGSLQPWQGYEVRGLQPCTLHLTCAPGAQGVTRDVAERRTPDSDDWRIGLVAEVNGFIDGLTKIGVNASGLTRGHPPLSPGVDLFVKAASVFGDSTPGYVMDLRSGAGQELTWELTVSTPQPEAEVIR